MPLRDLFKDIVIPLLPTLVAIIVPTLILYILPRRWQRQNLSLELFETFFREDMRLARLEAWAQFVTVTDEDSAARREKLFDLFHDFLSEPEVGRRIDKATHDLFQKTSRVLDFFAIVDGCIARGAVNHRMVRSFLAYYYYWWRLMVLEPLRVRSRAATRRFRHLPLWLGDLKHLDRVCNVVPPAS